MRLSMAPSAASETLVLPPSARRVASSVARLTGNVEPVKDVEEEEEEEEEGGGGGEGSSDKEKVGSTAARVIRLAISLRLATLSLQSLEGGRGEDSLCTSALSAQMLALAASDTTAPLLLLLLLLLVLP